MPFRPSSTKSPIRHSNRVKIASLSLSKTAERHLISAVRPSKARNYSWRLPKRVPLCLPGSDSLFRYLSYHSPLSLLFSPALLQFLGPAASMFSGHRAAFFSTRAIKIQPSLAVTLRPSSTPTLPRQPFSRAMSATTARPDPFKPAARVAGQRQDVWCDAHECSHCCFSVSDRIAGPLSMKPPLPPPSSPS